MSEIRIGVRSGAASDSATHGTRPVKVAVVSGGRRPMLWLGGAEKFDGLAWISGRDTLRRLRDALTEVLETGGEVERG
jgi:hypothetical protein